MRASSGGQVNLPGSLQQNRRLAQWLRFIPAQAGSPDHVLLMPGKVEIGQGIGTALAQIAAEELGVRLDQIQLAPASTSSSPNEAVTSGSLSIQDSGSAIRHACAQSRAILLLAAGEQLGIGATELECRDGQIHRRGMPGGPLASFWTLGADELLNREADASSVSSEPGRYRWVGQSAMRRDLPAKFAGTPSFIQDLRFDGLHYAVVLRHLVQGRDLIGADPTRALRLAERAREVIESLRLAKNFQVITKNCFVAMIADRDLYLERAIQTLQRRLTDEIERGAMRSDASMASPKAERRWNAEFLKPWLAHASIGLSSAIALWRPDASKQRKGQLEVWTHSQGIFNLRRDLHLTVGSQLSILETDIQVNHVPGAGCYGHNGADDVALDAVFCAIAMPGVPVRLQWTRSQELSSAPFSPAMRVRVNAATDNANRLCDWQHELWSQGHSSRPGRAEVPVLLAASEADPAVPRAIAINPPLAGGGGADRNSVPAYNVPNVKVVNHRLTSNTVRSSAFRGLGMGFARYKNSGAWCCAVARVEVTDQVRVPQIWLAVDAGLIINPDGARNQLIGGAVQATSIALFEQMRFAPGQVSGFDWERYRIIRFGEVPAVQLDLIEPIDQPALGAGEASIAPVVAAIGNALAQALGFRMHSLPLSAERVRAALNDA